MRWYVSYVKKENKIELDGILLSNIPILSKYKKRNGIYYDIAHKGFAIIKNNILLSDFSNEIIYYNVFDAISKYNDIENANYKAFNRFLNKINKYEKDIKNDNTKYKKYFRKV